MILLLNLAILMLKVVESWVVDIRISRAQDGKLLLSVALASED